MNLNEAKQLLKKNGYIVEAVDDEQAYSDWEAAVKDKLWDLCIGNDISEEVFEEFLNDHADEIQCGYFWDETPKEYARTLFSKYF